MGHTVTVQGGSPPRDSPTKLTKGNSLRNPSSKSGGSLEENGGLGAGITRTHDFRTFSDDDLSQMSFFMTPTDTSSPLEGPKKVGLPRH
jgi:hypothetical protein